jgi:hypothetical protein
MKTIILIISFLFLIGCNLNLTGTSEIVNNQDDIINKIINNETFDIDLAIISLKDYALINCSFGGLNAVSNNNIAVRNHLLLSTLYYMNNNQVEHNNYKDTAHYLINYNLINDSIWNEGSSYYLYTELAINAYLKIIKDSKVEKVKENCNKWIYKYVMPDGTLAPIGDTRRYLYNLPYNKNNSVIFDSEETLIKLNDIAIFVRHPSKINKYKLSGHTHYDIGNLCIYKNNKCIVLPIGYPGFTKKEEYKLDNMDYENSIYREDWKNCWRIKNYSLDTVIRTDNSIEIRYTINHTVKVSRKVEINGNEISIKDNGSHGINLNIINKGYSIEVKKGKEVSNRTGLHCENLEDIVENKRIFISHEDMETEIILKIN